jgi:hypothetical protein
VSNMFMWMPPPSPGHTHNDEGEKGDKLRRRARARRLQNAFVCMGILCITFVATVTQFKHKRLSSKQGGAHEETAIGLRFRRRQRGATAAILAAGEDVVPLREEHPKKAHEHVKAVEAAGPDNKQDDFFDPDANFRLPEKSIYRLSVENLLGETESLARFAGMVTLVVNTACK